ncbi:MAG TPA: HlyD family efflux transporter periplasmic adaptor subunit [Terriglobales bacterium]|nr:HlyD family efflux transporter periplasmic adaptor subunit [Terriglobales bacterium]
MAAAPQIRVLPLPKKRAPNLRRWLYRAIVAAVAAVAAWGAWRGYTALTAPSAANVPLAEVRRGEVHFNVYAQGTLSGGNSEVLTAPMVNGDTLSIRDILETGTLVKSGDVVVQFDTSAQEYNLKQAQAALEQAQQQVLGAQATAAAQTEDDAYQLLKAQFDVQRAELQVRKNPIVAAVDAQKNDLNLAAAREHLRQLQQDVASRKSSNQASVALQQAAELKSQSDAATAQANIAAMSLKATRGGYMSIRENMRNGFNGLAVPVYQIGDVTDPGLAIAEIPDTTSWELNVTVSEFDRGHLAVGQPATAEFDPLPGQTFPARVKSLGGATGPSWNRQVKCVLELLRATPALKPGLSAKVIITTQTLRDALYVPSQAVFGPDGSNYVYLRAGGQFARRPIKVVSRSESQVVLQGVHAGDVIALANPEQTGAPAAAPAAPSAGAPGGGGPMVIVR